MYDICALSVCHACVTYITVFPISTNNTNLLHTQNLQSRLLGFLVWKGFFLCLILDPEHADPILECFVVMMCFCALGFVRILAALCKDRLDHVWREEGWDWDAERMSGEWGGGLFCVWDGVLVWCCGAVWDMKGVV